MKFLSLIATVLAAAGSLVVAVPTSGESANGVSYTGYSVYRFVVSTDEQIAALKAVVQNKAYGVKSWSDTIHMGNVDLNIPPGSKAALASVFKTVPNSVLIDDVQDRIDRERHHMTQNSEVLHAEVLSGNTANVNAATIFSDYQSLTSLVAFYNTLPGLKQISIGTSYLKANIPGFVFGTGPKHIVFHGGIHSREWISPASVAYITNFLVTDPSAAHFLTNFTFTVIPVVNVDGYAYTRASNGDRLWRKNRKPNAGNSCVGTDPNRNFNYKWSLPGASNDPCADDYYGPKAFDAPETLAVANYLQSLTNVVSYIDFHSYAELWMFPWGWTCNQNVPDYNTLLTGSNDAVKALKAVNGEQFDNGPICSTIYQASGSSVDWTYEVAGIKYSYAVELRPNQDVSSDGFILPASQIIPAGKEVTAAVVALWNYVITQI